MALLEMQFSREAGKRFNCDTCREATKRLRRCAENRWNFTGNDSNVFPIEIRPKGRLYGFCPGKANWYPATVRMYQLLVVATELGVNPYPGALSEQPEDLVAVLSWFAPAYNNQVVPMRAGLASEETTGARPTPPKTSGGNAIGHNHRRSPVRDSRRPVRRR